MIKLLLLEDDQVLAESLIELLESENFDIGYKPTNGVFSLCDLKIA